MRRPPGKNSVILKNHIIPRISLKTDFVLKTKRKKRKKLGSIKLTTLMRYRFCSKKRIHTIFLIEILTNINLVEI